MKDQGTPPTPTEPPTPTPTEPKAGETPPKEGDKPTGAPEKYADFTLPEGVALEPASVESAVALFKELGLPQEAAQKLMDYHVKNMQASADASTKAYNDMRADWQAQTKTDPDLGPKLTAIKETNARAWDAIVAADPTNGPKLVEDFKSAMNLTGVGDHPAFIKMFSKLAERFVEGRHVAGTQPSKHGQNAPGTTDKPSAAKAMYPNNP